MITLAQAEADLARNLDWAEACVERYAATPNDNEFAAMVSLCFNIGPDSGAGFPSSTVLRLHNRGDKAGAAAAFAMWRKMRDPNTGGLVNSAGLLRRRNLEANLYLTPVPERTTVSVGEAQTPIEVTKLPPLRRADAAVRGGGKVGGLEQDRDRRRLGRGHRCGERGRSGQPARHHCSAASPQPVLRCRAS